MGMNERSLTWSLVKSLT